METIQHIQFVMFEIKMLHVKVMLKESRHIGYSSVWSMSSGSTAGRAGGAGRTELEPGG